MVRFVQGAFVAAVLAASAAAAQSPTAPPKTQEELSNPVDARLAAVSVGQAAKVRAIHSGSPASGAFNSPTEQESASGIEQPPAGKATAGAVSPPKLATRQSLWHRWNDLP